MAAKKSEKEIHKLHEFLQQQDFESIEELNAFMDQFVGKKIEDIIPQQTGPKSAKEVANDLVNDAYDSPVEVGVILAEKAIELDPTNADAFNYLGDVQEDVEAAISFYKKGMDAGREAIGEKDFEEYKGHFWLYVPSRPFMRSKASYADCLYAMDKIEECLGQLKEMIELNPSDNLGMRYRYGALLIYQNRFEEYEQLKKLYPDEGAASWAFNYALYLFITSGNTKKANKALLEAHGLNPHIVPLFIGELEMPDLMPGSYRMGEESEAIEYIKECGLAWIQNPKALVWIDAFYQKRKKIN